MPVLIDGYNLLHAMGVLNGPVGPAGLRKARLGLFGLLRGAYGDEAAGVTVVFDAAAGPRDVAAEQDSQGIHVRFAVHEPEADDLIELLIRQDSAPRLLTVVSDDHRIQKAARRRHCVVLGCMDFFDKLDQRRRQRFSLPPTDEKASETTPQQTRRWLEEFAGLEDDPDWKDVFKPFDFEEGPPL